MKYEKPSAMTLDAATQAIQSHDGAKNQNLVDLVFMGGEHTSNAAYEADE